jgi:acetyltransferase-like isoleucine patch superfamily enzyme
MRAEIVTKLLFEYEQYNQQELEHLIKNMPPKILRWLGAFHPDNKTRKIFFKATNIAIGDDTVVNSGLVVSDDYMPLLNIGRRVAISPDVKIICVSSPNNSLLLKLPGFVQHYVKSAPVVIDDDVWVGTGAIILPGVQIHQRAIIGAGAVVTKSVPAGAVVMGCPAKVVRQPFA